MIGMGGQTKEALPSRPEIAAVDESAARAAALDQVVAVVILGKFAGSDIAPVEIRPVGQQARGAEGPDNQIRPAGIGSGPRGPESEIGPDPPLQSISPGVGLGHISALFGADRANAAGPGG